MRSKAGMANRPRDVDWRFVQVSPLSNLAWLGSIQHFTAHQRGVSIHGSPMKGVRAPYCASAANWLHRPYSHAGSRLDHSAHLRSTGCTDCIHSPAVDRTTMPISGQPAAQAAFTCLQPTRPPSTSLANRMHRQHSPACYQPDLICEPDHCAHVRQLATQAFTRLQPTGSHRWSETSSWQLNHGFLPQNSTLL